MYKCLLMYIYLNIFAYVSTKNSSFSAMKGKLLTRKKVHTIFCTFFGEYVTPVSLTLLHRL